MNSPFQENDLIVIDTNIDVASKKELSYPLTAHNFTLRGQNQSGSGERIKITTNTKAGTDSKYHYALINLGVDAESSISIEDIDFQANRDVKSGLAININNGSRKNVGKFKSFNLKGLSFSNFNDTYVIGIDADKQSPNKIGGVKDFKIENLSFTSNNVDSSLLYSPAGIEVDNLSITNLEFQNNTSDNTLASINGIKIATIQNIQVHENETKRGGILLDGAQDDSQLSLENVFFSGNKVGNGSTLTLQQFQTLTVKNSDFTQNSTDSDGGALALSPDGGAAVGADPKDGMPLVENVQFDGNTAGGFGGAVYSVGNVHFVDTGFTNNRADQGGGAVALVAEGKQLKSVFTNVTMTGNDSAGGSAIYAEYQSVYGINTDGIEIDVEALGKSIQWTGANDAAQTSIHLQFRSADASSAINIGLYSDEADDQVGNLQILGGVSVTSKSSTSPGVSNISIGGSTDGKSFEKSDVKLGGKSTFERTTVNFDVKAGRFELLSDADLRWEAETKGQFTVAMGTEFAVSLLEVDPADVADHGERAKIHLAGKPLGLATGSALSVNWNERLESLPAVGSHWLILAEDAKLTEESAPDIAVETGNWILDYAMKVNDGAQLTQGIVNEDGTLVEGTEGNVYVGFDTESTENPGPIDPDNDIRSATNLTAHFAYSAVREVSRGVLHTRPVRSDAFWAIPQYLHDRRDRDDFGVGFDAQLRGITIGKDFKTDNGFWGAALGYGDGHIHSLGGIAYTSGDVQSWWAGVYGQHNVDDWRFEGLLTYLCQDADQDQRNSAADLHLNTKNDVILVSGKVARSFVLDQNAERTIRMTPSVGLEYVWLKQRDFNVRMKSGETLLKGKAEDMNVFSVPIDWRFDRDWSGDGGWRHNASLTVGGSFNFGDDTMSGDFEGPNSVATDGWRLIPLDDYQGRVVAEYILLHPNEKFSISAGAGYTFSKSRELLDLQTVIRYVW